jgi:hypothetical protein
MLELRAEEVQAPTSEARTSLRLAACKQRARRPHRESRVRGGSSRADQELETEFVAVRLPQVANGLKVVIDLAGRDGEQVRIDLSGGSALDVVALANAFWKRQS